MNRFILWFVKITAWLPAQFYYKTKAFYKGKQKRKIKGKAIIVSNHISVMDYPLYMYLFFGRCLRTVTAEVIYQKGKFMNWFLKKIGCIKVDRNNADFGFMHQSVSILNKKGVVLIFPEARLHLPDEVGLLEFKPSFVYMALESGAPIIPCFTNGSYGKKERAKVIVGEKIYLDELYDNSKTEKENIEYLCEYVKNHIRMLGDELSEK